MSEKMLVTQALDDLYTICNNCGERGDYHSVCPKCGSKNLKQYGKDTSIYVDKNNLTENIELSMNPDSVKNCFKLEAGDDLMTSTVRLLNMGNSDYIIYVPEYQRKDKAILKELSSAKIKVYDSNNEIHTGITGRFTTGNLILNIVNGIIVDAYTNT